MRTQPIFSAHILDTEDTSEVLEVSDYTISGLIIPTGSDLDTKVLSFISIYEIDGADEEFEVVDDSGTLFEITLADGKHYIIPTIVGASLVRFKVTVDSPVTEDSDIIFVGYLGR